MTVAAKLVAACATLALLAGCGNDKSGPNPVASTLGVMAKQAVAKTKAKPSDGQPATRAPTPAELRAELEKAGKPVLLASSKTLGQTGFLTVSDAKGEVTTWRTPDGVTFSQRDGVLIQTRGLGADLMSAETPSVAQLRSGAAYQRIYYFLGADDQGTRRTYDCTATVVGKESIEVVARSHATLHVTELCERPLGKLTNDYWLDDTTIRQSRQWVSGAIGYVEFQPVID